MPEITENEALDLEKSIKGMFGKGASAGGEEELLKVVAEYAIQISAQQMRVLMWLRDFGLRQKEKNPMLAIRIDTFIAEWREYKKNHQTVESILKANEAINLGKWIKAGLIDINVQKK